jgi:hypothetical protein
MMGSIICEWEVILRRGLECGWTADVRQSTVLPRLMLYDNDYEYDYEDRTRI